MIIIIIIKTKSTPGQARPLHCPYNVATHTQWSSKYPDTITLPTHNTVLIQYSVVILNFILYLLLLANLC